MTPGEDAIRARRKLTNKLIAAHDARRLRPFFDPNVTVIPGAGGLILGVDAMIAAFEQSFADPTFITYERTTTGVAVDHAGQRAAEDGTWTGSWRGGPVLSGAYMACWKKTVGQWVLESELYVTLREQ